MFGVYQKFVSGFMILIMIAGEKWQSKIKRTLQMMEDHATDVLLITNLDEIACKCREQHRCCMIF